MENKENRNKYTAQIKHIKSHYKKFQIDFKNETFQKLQEVCKNNNTTPTTEIKKFVEEYIKSNS